MFELKRTLSGLGSISIVVVPGIVYGVRVNSFTVKDKYKVVVEVAVGFSCFP